MGTSRIYPLTFSLRLHIKSKRECKSGIWLSALPRNMSHPLLGNSLFVSSAWKYGICQTCLETKVNILSLMLASTRCLRKRSESLQLGRYGIIPFLSACFGEQYSKHGHKHRHKHGHVHARWKPHASESSFPGNIAVFCVKSSIFSTQCHSIQQTPGTWHC